MKVPTTREGVGLGPLEAAPRPVPRRKRSQATSLCASRSWSYAYPRRGPSSYRFPDTCFCLSPEQHGAQFQTEAWEDSLPLKGHC